MIIAHDFEIRSKRIDNNPNNPNETNRSNVFHFERIFVSKQDVKRGT